MDKTRNKQERRHAEPPRVLVPRARQPVYTAWLSVAESNEPHTHTHTHRVEHDSCLIVAHRVQRRKMSDSSSLPLPTLFLWSKALHWRRMTLDSGWWPRSTRDSYAHLATLGTLWGCWWFCLTSSCLYRNCFWALSHLSSLLFSIVKPQI